MRADGGQLEAFLINDLVRIDTARDLFDRSNLFPRETWQRQYDRVQKPDEIREIEEIPCPNGD
ncbi:hypothetical protein QA600_14720 [Natronococcus sp. A-GB1]|uniref:hypothetical protein n=1 Tax=Natronococcus sp. A-GB1 TaxID=3037648 RepID=UPI00241F6B89|nr:hypothetical protein [Natronococcus sp. A-GB1]MDG5760587.1 hypothetical protein [Natronococcus sp. A-GB1]